MAVYTNVVYDEKVRPYTEYPSKLCWYLFNRFGLKGGDRLLDAGCGRGDFSKGYKDLGLEVSGLDNERSDSRMLTDIDVKYTNMENESFPFEDETFDAVFSKSVIEHLFNPDNVMKECLRVLKPGGRIIIMTPDWISQMKIFFDDYTHRQPYTVDGVRDMLNIFGFGEVNSGLFYQLPVLWKYPVLRVFSRILRMLIPVTIARNTKIKFIRWSVELMVLGTGIKPVKENE